MNPRYNYLSKIAPSLLAFILTFASLCHTAAAQSEEEMQILQMFYKEKDLVISATRHPKPVSQVAENVTIITAKDIENMNAHTVADVLNRVPGLFISFNQDFGASSLLQIQGSEPRHVLVLLDGIPWNFLADGHAETNSIPVGIIDRIEIIKGPASSAWGSSLGGVVNIITKSAGTSARPEGTLRASYGERNTQDYRAAVSGKAGPVGYYLFAGRQKSDGLRASRNFDTNSLYSKFEIPVASKVNLEMSVGYSDPEINFGDYPSGDISQEGKSRAFFSTASLDASLTKELSLKVSFHHFNQKFVQMNDALGLGFYGPKGERFLDSMFDEESTGGSGKLVWEHGIHTAVLGVDIDHGKLAQRLSAGSFLQFIGIPPISSAHPDIEQWAVYANDSIVINRWSITPGIRYDHNSITDSFVSPSLGVTYRLGKDSIVRASVARGFTIPPLSWASGGSLFLDPNPSLEPEKVWSYQAGVESAVFRYLWVKATFFRHELEDAFTRKYWFDRQPPAFNDIIENKGERRRQGGELEVETTQIYNLSLLAGFAYVHLTPPDENESTDMYMYTFGLRYDDRKSFRAELFGHYIWWDLYSFANARYDDFIWDLNLNKRIYSHENTSTELFLTAHNLFNGAQYTFGDSKNPRRWIEAGIRIKFK
ncbi:MAG: TonB-dependent receptor [Pseudomonadota bacterium]